MKQLQFVLLLFLLLLSSCSENLDFNQLDDYTASPVITSSLVYFTLTSNRFIDPVTALEISNLPPDESDFTIFDAGFIRNNLIRVVFDIEVKNEIDRGFTLLLELLDDTGVVVYTLSPINISPTELDFTYQETIVFLTNPNIIDATKIRISVGLVPSTNPLIANDPSEFVFKSSITLYTGID